MRDVSPKPGPTGRRRLTDHLRSEEGWAGTAIAYPAVVVFCLALFQFGFYYVAGTAAASAAEIAYQQTRSYQASNADGVAAAHAAITADGPLLTDGQTTISRTATTVAVTVTGKALVILPGLVLPKIQQTRSGPIERWVPSS